MLVRSEAVATAIANYDLYTDTEGKKVLHFRFDYNQLWFSTFEQ